MPLEGLFLRPESEEEATFTGPALRGARFCSLAKTPSTPAPGLPLTCWSQESTREVREESLNEFAATPDD